jgi:hypothetical protein
MMQGNPHAWDRDGNLIVPRYGIRIAMAVALFAAGAFQLFTFLGDRSWHQHHPDALPTRPEPLWMLVLWIAFPLVPFTVSALLLSRRSEESKAAGAGLAAALFGCGFVFAAAVFVAEFVGFPAPDPYVFENLIVTLVFLVCGIWIIVSAFRIAARASWGLFFLSAAATVVWIAVTSHFLSNADSKLDRRHEQHKAQTDIASAQTNHDAHQILARLAGCLIEYHAAHPASGFPPSLEALPGDLQLPQGTVCDATIASDGSVPNYTFTYTPKQSSSGSGFTDFRLLAMPLKKGLPHLDPIGVDGRGRIFSYIGWSVTDQQPFFVPRLVETADDFQISHILSLREEIRLFMQANGGTPPAMLSKMSEYSDKSGYNETLTEGPYRLEYFPPAAGAANTYMISAVCQSYGDACIRSFFVDQNGEIHETSEPRQPTARDRLIPDCEKYGQTCRDIDWPQP